MKQFFALFDFSQRVDYKTEILAGLTVALALIPEAIGFALIAGLSLPTGLDAAFTIGLFYDNFWRRPGMISGATWAVAVVGIRCLQAIKIMPRKTSLNGFE